MKLTRKDRHFGGFHRLWPNYDLTETKQWSAELMTTADNGAVPVSVTISVSLCKLYNCTTWLVQSLIILCKQGGYG